MTEPPDPVPSPYGEERSPFRPAATSPLLERAVPVAGELPAYRPRTARRDVIAGVTVAALARVREDFMSGVRSGVNGTPSFYINAARHDDSYDIETLLAALERAATSE